MVSLGIWCERVELVEEKQRCVEGEGERLNLAAGPGQWSRGGCGTSVQVETAVGVRLHFSMMGRTCKDKGPGGFRKACFYLKPKVTDSAP